MEKQKVEVCIEHFWVKMNPINVILTQKYMFIFVVTVFPVQPHMQFLRANYY